MLLRILVVDDFEPFRRYLSSALKPEAQFEIVGEARDGMEAIHLAAELQPDLVLLDVGLPKLNGLEAARQIRKAYPPAKILFISQEFSFDVVEAALRAGALGYIHKLRVGKELLPAIDAVSRDRYFVSGVLKEKSRQHDAGAPARHEVQFYEDDAILLKSFGDFAATQLKDGKAVIVAATELHRAGVLEGLKARGVDVDQAIAAGTLIPLDAVEILSRFMGAEMPDPDQFFDVMEELIAAATRTTDRVAACGELAPVLLTAGKTIQAIRVEQLWDLMVHRYGVDTLCGYSLADLEKDSDVIRSVSAEHSAVYST